MRRSDRGRRDQRGQAIAEFALTVGIFIVLLIGALDLGRGVYIFNGVSEAAREIARTTSIFPGGATLGSSSETAAVVATQQGLVPGLSAPLYDCIDIAGTSQSGTCSGGKWVRVSVSAPYQPATPLLAIFGAMTFASTSSAEVQ
ncbi:MAG TPA: TadE family protein [Candidatus Limnocylindrales bacterium]|nr:TadE family protein [Candidatus Limnocylindrales bacterium]